MADAQKSYLRMLHAVPGAPAVDLYFNDELVITNFYYKEFSKYYDTPSGIYNLKVTPTNQKKTVLLNQNFEVENKGIYTLAIIGTDKGVMIELIYDRIKTLRKDKTYIRYINLSPPESIFDIIMNNKELTSNLAFREISGFIELNPETYKISLKDSITGKVFNIHPGARLLVGKQYAGYIVGFENGNPELEILLPLEGATYLTF